MDVSIFSSCQISGKKNNAYMFGNVAMKVKVFLYPFYTENA